MNKLSELSNRFNIVRNGRIETHYVVNKSDVEDKNKELLDYIYGVDECGIPRGDLAVFLGEDANPQVKAFIQSQLMADVNQMNDGLSMSQELRNTLRGKIGDDEIAQFSRNHDETNEEYASRLKRFFDEVRTNNKRVKAKKEIENAIKFNK